ncbi:hypothetical protein [Microlunatus sp. Gsoil 973]|uniref:hypothetical protein n=1 Tax=Microlunatus sp. Gsoil 973 TaxID=2672569 RepID=UPI0012B4BD8F|nr:hypothetical protein [Microlunatus sp. Gsoil 973]QGN34501.1 hypothetical protein GJV80_18640 [Microlunatus sp. Gsoil 973]
MHDTLWGVAEADAIQSTPEPPTPEPPMPQPPMPRPPAVPAEEKVDIPDGVSAFVAKVLNQLSLSAWLPATLFAASVTLLVQFRADNSWSVSLALDRITDDWKKVLLLAVPALVLATMVTQASSFAAIRFLEGYWRRNGPLGLLRSALIYRHVRRLERLQRKRNAAADKAFAKAKDALRGRAPYTPNVLSGLEMKAIGRDVPDYLTAEERGTVRKLNWRSKCNAWDLAKVDHLEALQRDYPALKRRIMPTKLGNVLRRTEDNLRNTGGDLSSFVMRRREKVSPRIQLQHDQFRDRLDMYCTLVFVSGALSMISVALLLHHVHHWWQIAVYAGGFLGFACVSYSSAVSSARGYCVALQAMDDPPSGSVAGPAL